MKVDNNLKVDIECTLFVRTVKKNFKGLKYENNRYWIWKI